MKNKLKKLLLMAPLVTGVSFVAMAQVGPQIDIITTAVPFLRISPDARAGGMGDAGIVMSPDANAQFYNMAKYPFTKDKSGIGFTYTPWLNKLGMNDIFLATLAGYYKLDDNQALSGSLRYFSLGDLQIADHDGNDLFTERPREMSIDAGYSRKLGDRMSMGLTARYIRSNLAGNSSVNGVDYKVGNTLAADLGFYYTEVKENTGGWSAGVVLSNLGGKISYTSDAEQKSYLPANLGIGVGRSWVTNEIHKLSLNGELNKLLVHEPPQGGDPNAYRNYNQKGVVDSWMSSFGNDAMAYSLGGEYVYNSQFAARVGYYTDSRSMGKRSYFTTGLGISYNVFDINFSYLIPTGDGANLNPLSNTIRFGVLIGLDGN